MPYDPDMIDTRALFEAIRTRADELGFDLVGFARAEPFEPERELILESLQAGRLHGMGWITDDRIRLSCDPQALLPGARTIVALGTSYATGPEKVGKRELHGRVARYAWGRDYHDVIPPRLKSLAESLVELGGSETRCRTFVDTGPLVDRAAAARAGLGFVGKNTCVLTGRHGSYVFLSAVLTTLEIDPDPVVTRDCGSCRACLDACPTGALIGPHQMDATRCISYLTIEHRGSIPTGLRPLIGDWVFGCDVCQEVCPWNRARPAHDHPELAPTEGAGATLDLPKLLAFDDAAFRARFRGTPLTRTKRRGLLRNAAVVLGNQKDPRAVPALTRALADPEPLVRSHAAWALAEIGELPVETVAKLKEALSVEIDEEARGEIAEAISKVGLRRA
jgi:epoxyqueuosine reductase